MKKIILLLIVFLITSCGSQKNNFKLKTLNKKNYTINYPNTWSKFIPSNQAYFFPKDLPRNNPSAELNRISFNNYSYNIKGYNDIEKLILDFANSKVRNEKIMHSKLIKITNHSNFIYKIESTLEYSYNPSTFKRDMFFYKVGDVLQYIQFQMREDLYNKYINDALLIINSLKLKKY